MRNSSLSNKESKSVKSPKSQSFSSKDYNIESHVLSDLKESFKFYENNRQITRNDLKSIMGNFGWSNCPPQDLEDAILDYFPQKEEKDTFNLDEVRFLNLY